MKASPDELIPVCGRCRAGKSNESGEISARSTPRPRPSAGFLTPSPPPASRSHRGSPPSSPPPSPGSGGADAPEWMVRKGDGQVYGPFPASMLREWIRTGKLLADEEVSRVGGAWRLMAQHEEFGRHFAQVSSGRPSQASHPPQSLDFRIRKPMPMAVESSLRGAVALAFMVVVVVGVFVAVRKGVFLVPEELVSQTAQLAGQITSSASPASPPSPKAQEVTAMVAELQKEHGVAESRSARLFWLRGREAMRKGTMGGLREARLEMERAVATDPYQPLALSGLAEVYNRLFLMDPTLLTLQQNSFYFIEKGAALGEYGAEIQRARAWFLLAAGHPDEALMQVKAAMKAAVDDPELEVLLGMILVAKEKGLGKEAAEAFNRALTKDPTLHEAHYQLGIGALTGGDLYRAEEEFRKVLAVQKGSARAHEQLGKLLEQAGDLKEATSEYGASVSLQPDLRPAALSWARLLYQTQGRPGEAAAVYQRILRGGGEALPSSQRREILGHRAAALRSAGNLEEAVIVAREALALTREDPLASFVLGQCLADQGKLAEAASVLARGEGSLGELSPVEEAWYTVVQGEVARREGRFMDAISAYERALDRAPHLVPASLFRGGVYMQMGQKADGVNAALSHARKDPLLWKRPSRPGILLPPVPDFGWVQEAFREAGKEGVFDPELTAVLAAVSYQSGDRAGARQQAQMALKDDPAQPVALLYLGLLDLDAGNFPSAVSRFEALVDVQRDVAIHHMFLGFARWQAGDGTRGEEDLRRGFAHDRNLAMGHCWLGGILSARGNTAEARTELNTSLTLAPTLLEPPLSRYKARL